MTDSIDAPGAARIFVAITPRELEVLYSPPSLARLRGLGEVVLAPDTGELRAPLPDRLADEYDVLITSWSTAPFDPSVLSGTRLKYAAHTAGTVRGLFPKHVLEQGLRLAQGGSAPMATAVAELALTLTLVLLRDVHSMDRRLQATRDWAAGGSGTLTHGIREQTIGVVGLSGSGASTSRWRADWVCVTSSPSTPSRHRPMPRLSGCSWWGSRSCASAATCSRSTPPSPTRPGGCSTPI